MTAVPLRVALYDRQGLFRDGLAELLASSDGIVVLAAVASLDAMRVFCAANELDVAIFDLDEDLPAVCDAVSTLSGNGTPPRAVGLHDGLTPEAARLVFAAGVRAIVARTDDLAAVVAAVRAVPWVAAALGTPARAEVLAAPDLLSAGELEILRRIGRGASVQGIAADLGMKPRAVEQQKQRIFEKLGARHQAHAVALAMRAGLLTYEGRPPPEAPPDK